MGRERLAQFGRHARSLIAIPVRYGSLSAFDAVICIDMLPALPALRGEFEGLADVIQSAQSAYMASLIAVREL